MRRFLRGLFGRQLILAGFSMRKRRLPVWAVASGAAHTIKLGIDRKWDRAMAELTPMMKQYLEIKKQNPDTLHLVLPSGGFL